MPGARHSQTSLLMWVLVWALQQAGESAHAAQVYSSDTEMTKNSPN